MRLDWPIATSMTVHTITPPRYAILRIAGVATGFALFGALAYADDKSVAHAVAPTGSLRVAIGVGPAASEFWATRDAASGELHGVTVELAKLAAARLDVPLQLVAYHNSGEIAAAGSANAWDISFMPADSERAKVIDQGPPYVVYISSYLVRPGSDIVSLVDVDQVGHHVGCIEGTSTSRTLAKSIRHASLTCYAAAEDGAKALREGKIDALAMGRGALSDLAKTIPGSQLLNEPVQTTHVVVVVPKGRAEAAAWAARFVEEAKADGSVRRVLDVAGFAHAAVAPPVR
jgi:polar amino acid transport system substrate-binding protein